MFSAVAVELPGCIWFLLENMFFYVYQNLSNDVNDFNLGSCIFLKRIMLHNTKIHADNIALHCIAIVILRCCTPDWCHPVEKCSTVSS